MAGMTQTKKSKKGLPVILLVIAIVAAALALTSNSRKYNKANECLARGEYRTAVALFNELGDYENAEELLKQSRYGMACQLMTYRSYDEALEIFKSLGDYSDSTQQIFACYYGLGEVSFRDGDYETAKEYFVSAEGYSDSHRQIQGCYYYMGLELVECDELVRAIEFFKKAGDYEDAAAKKDEVTYQYAHELFVTGLYDMAEQYFQELEKFPENGVPHFLTLNDAREYFDEQRSQLKEEITCYVGQMPVYTSQDELWDLVGNYIPIRWGSTSYNTYEKRLNVTYTLFPSDRILYAWRTGDDSLLTESELETKKIALKVVKEAEAKETPFDQELYIYNWLCNNVTYETPNMDVPVAEYLALRQLNCVGALVDGKANCQGYSDAFYLMGTMLGFDICRINGDGENEPHTWNGILLDGKLYMVDVTFGDLDELGKKAKTYTWFNCAYDSGMYTIDGGPECFPELVTEDDLSHTYYKHKKSVFTKLNDAVYYLLRQYKKNGKGLTYAVVEDVKVSNKKLESALSKNSRRANVYSYNCSYILEYYDGDSYITIKWK